MCVCMYVCMYVCIYIYIYTHGHIYIYTHVYMISFETVWSAVSRHCTPWLANARAARCAHLGGRVRSAGSGPTGQLLTAMNSCV